MFNIIVMYNNILLYMSGDTCWYVNYFAKVRLGTGDYYNYSSTKNDVNRGYLVNVCGLVSKFSKNIRRNERVGVARYA